MACTWMWTYNDSSTTCVTDDIWLPWCDSSSTMSVTWGEWNQAGECPPIPQWAPPVETAAQIAAREAEAKRVAAAKARAEEQAERLLLELLTPEQRAGYREAKRFHVITQSGKRYEVDCKKRMHNIFEVDPAGRRIEEHCIYQSGNLPLPDNTVAQLLMLTANEAEFRRIANQTRVA